MIRILSRFFTGSELRSTAMRLYSRIVEQARSPEFYRSLGVPDSPTGRFDMVALHGILVMRRLTSEGNSAGLAQELSDTMFADLDRNLREMGVGDLSVGKHMKKLASHYFGRVEAYEDGLVGNEQLLQDALRRNLYATAKPAPAQIAAMAGYVRAAAASLKQQPLASFSAGSIEFAPIPDIPVAP
jgi:cytochrome b pre-mRNA-processing protein 3